jgi:hypothetical protein
MGDVSTDLLVSIDELAYAALSENVLSGSSRQRRRMSHHLFRRIYWCRDGTLQLDEHGIARVGFGEMRQVRCSMLISVLPGVRVLHEAQHAGVSLIAQVRPTLSSERGPRRRSAGRRAPDFGQKYQAHVLEKACANVESAQAIERKRVEMATFMELYKNPAINVAITFIEPRPVGW